MPEAEPEKEPIGLSDAPMRAAVLSVLACGLCFAVVGLALFGLRDGLGVAAGGLIATLNLWVFARVGQAFMSGRGRAAPWALIAMVKLTLLFGGVWMLLKSGLIGGIPLAAGYAALPFGIVIGSLFGPKPRETDDDATPSARRPADVIKAGPNARRKAPGRSGPAS